MPVKKRTMPSQDPTPLRKGKAYGDPSPDQELALGAFLAAMVVGYHGVYVTRYAQSGAIKLKVYADGEAYEDALETNEEWAPVFGDYAKRFGVLAHYRDILGIAGGAPAVRAADGPEGGSEGQEGAPRSLRGS